MNPQYFELLLGWLFLALINGEVAHTRGRGRWSWTAVSVVLGPVATVAVVALPAREEAP